MTETVEALQSREPLPKKLVTVTFDDGYRNIVEVPYPAEQIAAMYGDRWLIELRFRDIKTTMGMEVLRGKTADAVRKEILMHLLAYNLIRCLMWQAAAEHGRDLRRLSLAGTVDRLNALSPFVGSTTARLVRQSSGPSCCDGLPMIGTPTVPTASSPAPSNADPNGPPVPCSIHPGSSTGTVRSGWTLGKYRHRPERSLDSNPRRALNRRRCNASGPVP